MVNFFTLGIFIIELWYCFEWNTTISSSFDDKRQKIPIGLINIEKDKDWVQTQIVTYQVARVLTLANLVSRLYVLVCCRIQKNIPG